MSLRKLVNSGKGRFFGLAMTGLLAIGPGCGASATVAYILHNQGDGCPTHEQKKNVEETKHCIDILVDAEERISAVKETITSEDLDGLRDNVLVDDMEQEVTMTQTLTVGAPEDHPMGLSTSGSVVETITVNGDNITGDSALMFRRGHEAVGLALNFSPKYSSHLETTGQFTASGDMVTLAGETLHVLGEDYVVTNANVLWNRGTPEGMRLNLMSGDLGAAAKQESFAFTHNNIEYEITPTEIEQESGIVTYNVNGRTIIAGGMKPGELFNLDEGIGLDLEGVTFGHIGVSEAGEARFAVDAQLLTWEDENITDGMYSSTALVNNKELEDVLVRIQGDFSSENDKVDIASIEYGVEALGKPGIGGIRPQQVHVSEGENLRDVLETPATIPGRKLNITYHGKRSTEEGASIKHLVTVCLSPERLTVPEPETKVENVFVQCGESYEFNLGDGRNVREQTGSSVGERLYDHRETLTSFDLPELLVEGEVFDTNGVVEVNQYLRLRPERIGDFPVFIDENSGSVVFDENEIDEVGNFLFFRSGTPVFTYELEFDEGFETRRDASGNLVDLIGETIPILGREYTVGKAQIQGSDDLFMELHSELIRDAHEVGESLEYAVNGKTYTIDLLSVNDITQQTTFRVNGQIVRLGEGEIEQLDGNFFLHKETFGDLVTYAIVDDTIRIEEEVGDSVGTVAGVQVREERIEDSIVRVRGTQLGNGNIELQNIAYQLEADAPRGNMYIPPNGSIREEMDEPEGLLGRLDIRYEGRNTQGLHTVSVGMCEELSPQSTRELAFTNEQGISYTMTIANDEDTVYVVEGKRARKLHFREPAAGEVMWNTEKHLRQGEYVVLSDEQGTQKNTRIFQYSGVQVINFPTGTVGFRDIGTQDALSVGYDLTTDRGELSIGGRTHNFVVNPFTRRVSMDVNGDGNFSGDNTGITTESGQTVYKFDLIRR